jgi:hypothetical protein
MPQTRISHPRQKLANCGKYLGLFAMGSIHLLRITGFSIKLIMGIKGTLIDQFANVLVDDYAPNDSNWLLRTTFLIGWLSIPVISATYLIRFKKGKHDHIHHTNAFVEGLEQYYGYISWLDHQSTHNSTAHRIGSNALVATLTFFSNYDPDLGWKQTFAHQLLTLYGRPANKTEAENKKGGCMTSWRVFARINSFAAPILTTFTVMLTTFSFLNIDRSKEFPNMGIAGLMGGLTLLRLGSEAYIGRKTHTHRLEKKPLFHFSRLVNASAAAILNGAQTLFVMGYTLYLIESIDTPHIDINFTNISKFKWSYTLSCAVSLVSFFDVLLNYKAAIHDSIRDASGSIKKIPPNLEAGTTTDQAREARKTKALDVTTQNTNKPGICSSIIEHTSAPYTRLGG